MNRAWIIVLLACLTSNVAASPGALTPACDGLTGADKQRALQLLETMYTYDCCDETLAACLKKDRPCRLAVRLSENICGRVAAGQDDRTIRSALRRRAKSMLAAGSKASIDLQNASCAGDAAAPVTVVAYACARCPFCARLLPQLHRSVTQGTLAGKVKLYLKLFPIRSHAHAKESAMAYVAAGKMGRFWEYALLAFDRFDHYDPSRQADWAAQVGLDRTAFVELLASPALRDQLVASKKEGLKNRVDATPTLFIDGHKYDGELNIGEVTDVLEEAYERARGMTHTG